MEKPKAIDIHSHVNFAAFDSDRSEIINRAHSAGVWMVNVGTEKETSKSAVELAEQFQEGMYATVGLHPIHAGGSAYHDKNEMKEERYKKLDAGFDADYYRALAQSKKVVAIGECGLDYYRLDPNTAQKQKEAFIAQIHLANELQKPLMLHVRGERGDDVPYLDALEILQKEAKVVSNFHFFAGSLYVAKKIWEAGFTTSFTGVITFARVYEKLIKEAPLEQILVETDCPYAAPEPHRGARNEPLYVLEVVKKIARIKDMEVEKVEEQLVVNTLRVFNVE